MTTVATLDWSQATPDAAGLVAAIVQHAESGQVLMLGYMNEEALAATLASGFVTFHSRSRGRLWRKGETSGATLHVVELRLDCDGDALLVRALPAGPTCHTGATSCFYRRVTDGALAEDDGPPPLPAAVLGRVFATILQRQAGRGTTTRDGKSYVRSLLDGGAPRIAAKLAEEADELGRAIAGETPTRVAEEAADLVFHALVGLVHRGVSLQDVTEVLQARLGISGIDEKRSRG